MRPAHGRGVQGGVRFGLVLPALVHAIGPISGCHVNPAVTLGVLPNRGIGAAEAGLYAFGPSGRVGGSGWPAEVARRRGRHHRPDRRARYELVGQGVNLFGALVVEIVLTALSVLVVLLVTRRDAAPESAGLAIGLVLTVIHLMGIPLTGTSVNPARSIGPAAFAGLPALSQLWLFIVAPLVGAVLVFGVCVSWCRSPRRSSARPSIAAQARWSTEPVARPAGRLHR